jgi:hypothetical protein
VLGAIVWSPISSVGAAAAVFALASFKVFSIRQAALIAEFFKGVSGCPESVRCRAQRVNEAAINPTLRHRHPSGKRPGGNRP